MFIDQEKLEKGREEFTTKAKKKRVCEKMRDWKMREREIEKKWEIEKKVRS